MPSLALSLSSPLSLSLFPSNIARESERGEHKEATSKSKFFCPSFVSTDSNHDALFSPSPVSSPSLLPPYAFGFIIDVISSTTFKEVIIIIIHHHKGSNGKEEKEEEEKEITYIVLSSN
ncbi:hypothetical protein SLA2020_079200 [Shorea laevis]